MLSWRQTLPAAVKAIRHLVLDLLALVLVAYAAFSRASWAVWAVGVYGGLLLLLKVVALTSKMRLPRPTDAPPELVYHLLYAASVGLLIFGGLYGLAALWAVVWVLDWYSARRR